MNPLELAKAWLTDEKPSTEEIQQSIDNLCHQVARPPAGVSVEQLQAAIAHLMGVIGRDLSELVLPEAPPKAELDLGPLGGQDDDAVTPLSPAERRQRFEELKIDLSAPF